MIWDGCKKKDNKKISILNHLNILTLSIATSIDALAVGVTMAFFNVNIILAITVIGVITFIICALGVKIGNVFGSKYENTAKFAGGVVLICIGLEILIKGLIEMRG